jgi:hypothetical protein
MRNSKTLGLQNSCADEYRFIDNHQDRSLPRAVAAREAAAQN